VQGIADSYSRPMDRRRHPLPRTAADRHREFEVGAAGDSPFTYNFYVALGRVGTFFAQQ